MSCGSTVAGKVLMLGCLCDDLTKPLRRVTENFDRLSPSSFFPFVCLSFSVTRHDTW